MSIYCGRKFAMSGEGWSEVCGQSMRPSWHLAQCESCARQEIAGLKIKVDELHELIHSGIGAVIADARRYRWIKRNDGSQSYVLAKNIDGDLDAAIDAEINDSPENP